MLDFWLGADEVCQTFQVAILSGFQEASRLKVPAVNLEILTFY